MVLYSNNITLRYLERSEFVNIRTIFGAEPSCLWMGDIWSEAVSMHDQIDCWRIGKHLDLARQQPIIRVGLRVRISYFASEFFWHSSLFVCVTLSLSIFLSPCLSCFLSLSPVPYECSSASCLVNCIFVCKIHTTVGYAQMIDCLVLNGSDEQSPRRARIHCPVRAWMRVSNELCTRVTIEFMTPSGRKTIMFSSFGEHNGRGLNRIDDCEAPIRLHLFWGLA